VDLVHYAVTQRQQTPAVAPGTLRPGDLVFRFAQPGGHVMLYLGIGDLVVQAGGSATGVNIGSWGHTDGFGTPLAIPPTPPPPSAADWFGPTAAARPVDPTLPYADAFDAAGARHQVAPALLAALAATTTGFRLDATGADGRVGVMGLSPATAAEARIDPKDPAASIDAAAARLVRLMAGLRDPALAVGAFPTAWRSLSIPALVPADDATVRFVADVTTLASAAAVTP
jgi:hypothetical protein